MSAWSLQDAKNRFSAVVAAALAGEPQRVTRRGKPAVVVLADEKYERLRHLKKAAAPTFAELLLAIPGMTASSSDCRSSRATSTSDVPGRHRRAVGVAPTGSSSFCHTLDSGAEKREPCIRA